ncbi:DUF1549 domain-containing protein [Novipirellula rosea]|uniref:DUF1549 domain-containing protein n=1 Tax=Novipirellula rosea TaxID=1031540 RepID=UPI0031EAAABD
MPTPSRLSSHTASVLVLHCLGIVSLAFCTVTAAATEPIDFAHDIVPILQRNCVTCHGGREAEGDFSLNTRSLMIESGMVEPEDSSTSELIRLISSSDPDEQMPPPDRPRLSPSETARLRHWIDQGMPWDDDFTFAIQSYEPPLRPRRPELPPAIDRRVNPIDRILDAYLSEHGLPTPPPIDDATFFRRVHLDLVGLLPTADALTSFQNDSSPDKRTRLVDDLLSREIDYADHWLTFFNDLLRNDYSGTGFITKGRRQISRWLYQALVQNKPFDQLTRELIAPTSDESRGYIDGIKWRGTVSAGQTLEIQFAQSVSQSFLGINMKCASCHDSFIDRWTLKEAYGLGAIYAETPLQLHRCDKPTGETQQASWLFPELGQIDASAPREERLQQLAQLLTHPENGRFTRTIVNRLWYRLMGRGIVQPLDAMQSEPWNEDLLDYLAVHLAEHQYDLKATLRLIATSAAYQSKTEISEDDSAIGDYVYRGPRARRMTAEQFLDAVWQLTGSAPQKFDAPVSRHVISPGAINPNTADSLLSQANWIWGGRNGHAAPANQEMWIRKKFDLPGEVLQSGSVLTCDNEFTLYVNGAHAGSSNDWTSLQSIEFANLLRKGTNELLFQVKNAGHTPNAAGLFFAANFLLEDQTQLSIVSDPSWEFHPDIKKPLPHPKGAHPAAPAEGWNTVSVVQPVNVWSDLIDREAASIFTNVSGSSRQMPMVRASLMKNNALMQSLGRPIRDQIVSMRPSGLTTLEAIDLANESSLAEAFASGAERWNDDQWNSTDELVQHLFQSALTRVPTKSEAALFRDTLGESPTTEQLQDALWAICMLPEFMLIR